MANDNAQVSATGSYFIGIDSDNDSNAQTFSVFKHVAGTPVLLAKIDEDANLLIGGQFQKNDGTIVMYSSSPTPSPLVSFRNGSTGGGAEVASIDADGKGDFNIGGIRTRTNAGAPSGGESGDVVLDTTNSRLYVNVGGTWKYTSLT